MNISLKTYKTSASPKDRLVYFYKLFQNATVVFKI